MWRKLKQLERMISKNLRFTPNTGIIDWRKVIEMIIYDMGGQGPLMLALPTPT